MEVALRYTLLTLLTLLTVCTVDTSDTVDSVDTVYTIEIALNRWNSGMYTCILLGMDGTLIGDMGWPGSKQQVGWMTGWSGVYTPQTVLTARAPALLKRVQTWRRKHVWSNLYPTLGVKCRRSIVELTGLSKPTWSQRSQRLVLVVTTHIKMFKNLYWKRWNW